jgi:KaiC/GvpD/RAD55 family RecA-like ATPase
MSRRHCSEADSTGGFDPESFVSATKLVKEPEERVDWLVGGLLPAGGLSLVIAKPKVGKSTFARHVAHAVARGDPFLGRRTRRGGVLYISVEERRRDVRPRPPR